MGDVVVPRAPLALSEEELMYVMHTGWRVSPIATATHFSALDGDQQPFQPAPHLELISDAIVNAFNGDGPKKIAVSMPPRHGKSTLCTKWTPEWALSSYPTATVGMCSYGADFANDWGRQIRNQLGRHEEWLGFSLAEDSQKANWWHTDQGGGMWTAGVGGAITGKGADLLIIDDPIKNDAEAYSLTYRDALWQWWLMTASTRIYPHSVVLIVMTRWHSDDLLGRMLSPEFPGDPDEWLYLELPAVWEQDYEDAIGRKKGDGLWRGKGPGGAEGGPWGFTAEYLLKTYGKPAERWTSLYQQRPLNTSGIGACYHAFSEHYHVRECYRDDRLAISWSLDFNVNPMSAVIAQVREEFAPHSHVTNEKVITCEVLDEITLPNSNTKEMCSEFYERYVKIARGRNTRVLVYGDPAGVQRRSSADQSDWEIVKRFLADKSIPFEMHVPSSHPTQRARVNAVNEAFERVGDEMPSLFISPKCSQLKLDLKEVRWKKDANGNGTSQIDKTDQKRTHISDALGYMIHQRFALNEAGGERQGMLR